MVLARISHGHPAVVADQSRQYQSPVIKSDLVIIYQFPVVGYTFVLVSGPGSPDK